jgi:hypothetical protein
MNHPITKIIWKTLRKHVTVVLLLTISAVGAFAALGDGKIKSDKPSASLLTKKSTLAKGFFSLRSGYSYRGSQVINTQNPRYVNLNTTITYQKGHTTYIVPLRKKIVMDKITFNPNAATRN